MKFFRLIFFTMLMFSGTGCERARSFLHLDSNSPVPFLGLELSVDRRGQQPTHPGTALYTVSRRTRQNQLTGAQYGEEVSLSLPVQKSTDRADTAEAIRDLAARIGGG